MQPDTILNTDALTGLQCMANESVDCIVTSPPYWQLRDYGLEPILFGGDPACNHDFDTFRVCRLCGGWSGELGREPSREMFVEHLITIFDECRRVLKKTGTLWVNLGDSYSKHNKYNRPNDWPGRKNTYCLKTPRVDMSAHRVPHKSLCNIPGLFAEMMIGQGWILRNEIIWYKPSAIPMSAKDRFTVDFEKLFFFTKSMKYDFQQQFEPYAESTYGRYERGYNMEGIKNREYRRYGCPLGKKKINPQGRNKRCVWCIATENNRTHHCATYPTKLIETPIAAGCPIGGIVLDPFLGSGTTAVVARRLERHYIGIEPNLEYVKIAKSRLEKTSLRP